MTGFSLPDSIEQQTREAIAGMTDEQRMLETWLNDELPCEGSDTGHGPDGCSISVTHLANGCNKLDVPVCDVLVKHKRHLIEAGAKCGKCDEPAGDCWSYRPI